MSVCLEKPSVTIDDVVDRNEVARQIESGMLKAQVHPLAPLTILNYTQMAPWKPELWNETTDRCRGLIYNHETGELVARPFVKFWNYGDTRHPETMSENFPAEPPLITRKMDGSLGIVYRNPANGLVEVATRGSFTSEQAVWATAWLRTNWTFPQNAMFLSQWTLLVEIVYPANQIVVRYGWSGLTPLAAVNKVTGEEMQYEQLQSLFGNVVERFDKPLSLLRTEDTPNEEGYVVSWSRPGTHPLRVKIKFETYCRLHKLLTQTNAITVWEMLRDGKDVAELTKDVPAEYAEWIGGVITKLNTEHKDIYTESARLMLYGPAGTSDKEERKLFAEWAKAMGRYTPLLFGILDGKDVRPMIWKMIRPHGNDRTFKVAEG